MSEQIRQGYKNLAIAVLRKARDDYRNGKRTEVENSLRPGSPTLELFSGLAEITEEQALRYVRGEVDVY